jgi:hypothetical protein
MRIIHSTEIYAQQCLETIRVLLLITEEIESGIIFILHLSFEVAIN